MVKFISENWANILLIIVGSFPGAIKGNLYVHC